MTRTRYGSLYERLVANTHAPDSAHGCWEWKGKTDKRRGREGYPFLNVRQNGKVVTLRAHRVMVEQVEGVKLTPDQEVDHLCFNPRCVNPDHLEVTTKQVNLARRRYAT